MSDLRQLARNMLLAAATMSVFGVMFWFFAAFALFMSGMYLVDMVSGVFK